MDEREAIACLRLIVSMGRIDGEVTREEKAVLEDMPNGIRMPVGVTIEAMLGEEVNPPADQIGDRARTGLAACEGLKAFLIKEEESGKTIAPMV